MITRSYQSKFRKIHFIWLLILQRWKDRSRLITYLTHRSIPLVAPVMFRSHSSIRQWPSSVHQFHFLHCPEHFLTLQRQLRQAKLSVAARLADYLIVDCSFADEYHDDERYYERLQLKIHSCFTSLYRYHSPSFVILSNMLSNERDKPLRHSPYCHTTSLSYTDLFPRDRLVYLSPDSPNIMDSYEHNAIYILGGIFQKSRLLRCIFEQNHSSFPAKTERLTLEKARSERIRHQSLPLQQYFRCVRMSARNNVDDYL